MIINNMEEKMALMEKRQEILDVGEDNWIGEDPEMVEMKL